MILSRNEAIQNLSTVAQWDIVVIGGGATGLGTAVDAATRGYKTLLIEKYDFAKGTSSKSTKLVHGGVRYLANGDIKLVLGALKERGRIFQNAPHVASTQSFVIPSYGFFSKLKFLIGLKLYDWMAGKLRIGNSVALSKEEVIAKLPHINPNKLQGGILYFDGQFDDARLAINLAQTAANQGATLINYVEASKILKDSAGKVNGVLVADRESTASYEVRAKVVINATGIFVDDILKLDSNTHKNLVRPSQGAHIVVDKKFLGGSDALMIPETSDGRVLFGVPWHNHVLFGTTDTPINDHVIEPRPLEEEIEFILKTANQYLTNAPTRADVKSIYAGLRPLAAPKDGDSNSTKEISRDHKLIKSDSNLITITGGKWTTYRKMGEDTVNLAAKVAQLPNIECKTQNLKIHGYSLQKTSAPWQVYGSDAEQIKQLIATDPTLGNKVHPRFDHILAEVVWACQNEMVVHVEDFLARRTRILLLDAQAAREAAPLVAQKMAEILHKDQQWIDQEIAAVHQLTLTYMM